MKPPQNTTIWPLHRYILPSGGVSHPSELPNIIHYKYHLFLPTTEIYFLFLWVVVKFTQEISIETDSCFRRCPFLNMHIIWLDPDLWWIFQPCLRIDNLLFYIFQLLPPKICCYNSSSWYLGKHYFTISSNLHCVVGQMSFILVW